MEHYCQRIPDPNPMVLRLTNEDDPAACGKVARFLYESADMFVHAYDEEPRKWWLCAECYDFHQIFETI